MPARSPNFLFIGPDKSGSTWLYEALRQHRQVFLPRVKELFFFDQFYDNGWNWYAKFFRRANDQHRVIGEICHDYLFSSLACQRIAHDLPSAKLMVCLREPIQRAFSEFLYRTKVGLLDCDFESALKLTDDLVAHGRYATHLTCYFKYFKRNQIFIPVFDQLTANPQRFFDSLCDFLGIEHLVLSSQLREKVLPAGKPRLPRLAKFSREMSWKVRQIGFPGLVGKIKDSRILSRILYCPFETGEKPQISPSARQRLCEIFSPEIQRLDTLLGTDLSVLWGYSEPRKVTSSSSGQLNIAAQKGLKSDAV